MYMAPGPPYYSGTDYSYDRGDRPVQRTKALLHLQPVLQFSCETQEVRMKAIIVPLVLSFCLCGCSLLPPKFVTLTSTFNPAQEAWFNARGSGSIYGQALLLIHAGDVRTCAGLLALLRPKSNYADERNLAVFGSTEHGFFSSSSRQVRFSSDDPAYEQFSKSATCDAQGNFVFRDLPAGQYYVVAPVVWQADGSNSGGLLMQAVSLSAGETRHIILIRQYTTY